jgi:Zn-dependent protease with chaperone function/predicted Zn-dependent protease
LTVGEVAAQIRPVTPPSRPSTPPSSPRPFTPGGGGAGPRPNNPPAFPRPNNNPPPAFPRPNNNPRPVTPPPSHHTTPTSRPPTTTTTTPHSQPSSHTPAPTQHSPTPVTTTTVVRQPTASRPFGVPQPPRSVAPAMQVSNPWVPQSRMIAYGAPIRYVPIYVPAYRTVSPGWQQATQMIGSGDISGAESYVTTQMNENPSLDGMFSAVSAFQKAQVDTPAVQTLRTKTLELAEKQIAEDPKEPLPYVVAAKLSLEDGDEEKFRTTTDELTKKFPDSEYSHYYTGLKQLQDKDWKGAEESLRKAEQMGLPGDSVGAFLKAAIDNQQWVWEYAAIVGYVAAGWLVGLVLLFILGRTLSALTLRSVDRAARDVTSFSDRMLRRVYRLVVTLAGFYYYLSLPIVLVLAIAIPLALGYACLMLPYVNLGLIAIVLVAGCGGVLTAISGIRTAFVRVQEFRMGRPVAPNEAAALWEVTRDVAKRVGTRPVDEIRVIPSADIAVVELGGTFSRFFNRGKRVLILGVGAMQGLKLDAFKSILAHEYGHFQNRDTAGGNVSLRVNMAMRNFAQAIGKRGKIHWYDLSVQFLRLYHYLYRRLSFGASRLQEVLADRVAVMNYGKDALVEGLTHAIRRSVEFELAVSRAVRETLRNARPTYAFYRLSASLELDERDEVEKVVQQVLNRETNLDDSHPSPKDRFEMAGRIHAKNTPVSPDLAWSLVCDNDKVVGEMNRLVDDYIVMESRQIDAVNQTVIEFFTHVLKMNANPANYMERARLYMRQGRFDKAVEDLNMAADRASKDPNIFFRRAICFKVLERYQEAVDDLHKAHELVSASMLQSDEKFIYYITLGQCLSKTRQFEEAVDAFDQALFVKTDSLLALMERGRAHFYLQNYEKSLADFNAVIKHWPSTAEAYLDRAEVHVILGNKQQAEEDRAEAQWLAPHTVEAAVANLEDEKKQKKQPKPAAKPAEDGAALKRSVLPDSARLVKRF